MASQWSESVAGEWLIPSQLHLPTFSKGDVVYLFLSEFEQIGALPSASWAALLFLSQGCSALDQRPADRGQGSREKEGATSSLTPFSSACGGVISLGCLCWGLSQPQLPTNSSGLFSKASGSWAREGQD